VSAPQLAPATDWADVCEREVDYVYWTLRRFGASTVDAEDLVQDVFLTMWRRRSTYDPSRPLRAWIAGISFRVFSEHRRRNRREVPGGLIDLEDECPAPDDRVATAQARALVLAALARMPEKQRTVLVMHDLDGSSMRDIAEALSVPLFTLYSRLKSARRSFAKEVRRRQLFLIRTEDPRALLAAEREVAPAPPKARRRMVARLRGLTPPTLPTLPPPSAPAPRSRWPLALAAVGLLVVASLSGAAIERARKPILRGPVARWAFDDGAGSAVARDSSGRGHDCVLQRLDPAQAWRSGAVGTGLTVAGNGWLECPGSALQSVTSDLTVAAWVIPSKAARGYHALVAWQRGLGREDQFMFGFGGDELLFTSHIWSGRKVTRPIPAGAGEWVHVAVTRASNGTIVLYANGAEIGRGQSDRGRLEGGANPLIIGGAQNGPARDRTQSHYDGAIDELAIYDRALGPHEVAALAHARAPVVSSLR
jgi:RNA polymerase sigma-70 factor (ECF subfamily)